MEQKILYFGYGANRTVKMMEAITGNPNLIGKPASLRGFKLYVQRLDQIPDTISPTAPVPISPKSAILRFDWDETFESYTIKPGSKNDEVSGTVWALTSQERELVRDWELIDFGWYKDKKDLIAIAADGQKIVVETEILRDGQEVDREVDGKDYEPFLKPIEAFQRNAAASREVYLSRVEGNNPSKEHKT